MTKDEYCIDVCGAKCCMWWKEKTVTHICPHLGKDRKCRAYYRWKDNVCDETYTVLHNNELYEIRTKSIMTMIEEKLIPDWVIAQCCYAHPHLLEEHVQ